MKTVKNLTEKDIFEIYGIVTRYMYEHKDHVDALLKDGKNKPSIAPMGSDMWKPELYKAIHWNWFVEWRKTV